MPVTPGDFTASTLGKIQMEMTKIFRLNRTDNHLTDSKDWFKALFENQLFSLNNHRQVVIDGYDGRAFQGTWLQMCDMTVADNSTYAGNATDCDIDGVEVGSQTQSYTPNIGFHKEFKVEEDADMHNNLFTMEQKIARGLAVTLEAMDLELQKRTISSLDGAADTITAGDIGAIGSLKDTATTWDVPAASMTQEFIMDLLILAQLKKFSVPKLLNGSNYYKAVNLARFNADPNRTYEALFNGALPMVWDLFTADAQLAEKASFLVDNANIAYFNTRKYPNDVPVNKGDGANTTVFSVASPNLRWKDGSTLIPVRYDVKRQYKCIGNDIWANVFRVEHNGGIVYGPEACSGSANNVIRIIQDCAACAA